MKRIIYGLTALLCLSVLLLAGCGNSQEASSNSSYTIEPQNYETNTETDSETETSDNVTMENGVSVNSSDVSTTSSSNKSSQTTTTTAAAVTTKPPTAGIPDAKQVGSASFAPGSLYKGKSIEFRNDGDKIALGAWWWVLSGIVEPVDGVSVDMILDMLISNKVSEIYLDVGKMLPWDEEVAQGGITEDDKSAGLVSELYVRGFVKKCTKFGIRVAALTGASGEGTLRWIDPQYNHYYIKSFAEKIKAYNQNAKSDEKFYAIHLDVEPHTMGTKWNANREKYTQWMADMTAEARKQCDSIGVQLEYDVWSWFTETDTVTDASGNKINILDHMTKQCHTLGIMSYFNTGQGQFDRATNLELAYAKKNGARLMAGTETIKITPNNITYYYSGKDIMIKEQGKLSTLLKNCGHANVGGAIHHVYSWYALMRK